MSKIKEIELLIRDLIRINESIVTNYDSTLLCRDYENTQSILKELVDRKVEVTKNLTDSINEFFNISQNFITKRIPISSFKLMTTVIAFEYKFSVPKSVNKSSRQYFCYTCLMDKLASEYDVINKHHDGYYMLDITATLKLKELLDGE